MITIKKLVIENFANFKKAIVEFNERVTYLVGGNGDGKSTLGKTAIQAIMEGIVERSPSSKRNPIIGERSRFIYKDGDYAKGVLILHDSVKGCDITVRRIIKPNESTLTFEAPEGLKLDQDWLSSLFNSSFISSKSFTSLSPEEQAIALGIDTAKFDTELKIKKEDFTLIGRSIKEIGTVEVTEKVEPVDINVLSKEFQEITAANMSIEGKQVKKTKLATDLRELKDKYTRLKEEYDAIGEIPEKKDITDIQNRMNNAQETNNKALLYEETVKKNKKLQELEEKKEINKKEQKEIENKRLAYIQSFKFPFGNLSVDDKGRLLLNEKPIKDPYFSTGELIMITAKLHKTINPEFRYIYLQDFNLLDETNQKKIIEELIKEGFQLCIEYVSDTPQDNKKPNTIVLKDCEIVDNNEII